MTTYAHPTKAAKIAELKRELSQRIEVYKRLVEAGTLPRWRANFQYFVLKCILDDYEGDKTINELALIRWNCPLCALENFSKAGEQVVECTAVHGCGNGPFYLNQTPKLRTQGRQIQREALLINGIKYDYQTELFATNEANQ